MLAACYAASAGDVQLLGAAPGRKTDELARPLRVVPSANEPLAEVSGVDVHANVAVGARDHRDASTCAGICCTAAGPRPFDPRADGRVPLVFEAA